MNKLIKNTQYDLVKNDNGYYRHLQLQQDNNEKKKMNQFEGFSDIDMLFWYIHQQKHLDKSKENSKRTKTEYTRELKQFISHLLKYGQEMQLDIEVDMSESILKHIESRHLRKYQEWLATSSPYIKAGRSYSPATLSRKTTILKSFFTFLYESKYTLHNAAAGLKIASVRKDDRPNKDLGPVEVQRILDGLLEVDLRYYTMVLTLVTTGLRNEELCNLTMGNIKQDTIIGGYYFEVVGKGNKKRDVPIKRSVLDKIINYRAAYYLSSLHESKEEDPVFVTRNGKKYTPSYLAQALKKVIHEKLSHLHIQNNVTIHSFRHAYAIISHLNKVDVYDIMRSLGHEKIDTTMIYLQKVIDRSNNAIYSWNDNVLGSHLQ
ncbi:tyrosine-type recombinase/integrase [Kurthia gibsonii]|uniref:tyrosine-type recombinase/integrase n=1 Tax=Kurthia gibsonii TaxID=33946 RepID=UPI002DBE5A93|nr:tyrosine-type recombinase/integrase [Kurthia gibsonii]MEB7773578.1 tyrosine-type recombinase/integrase [Kurthia gibsonii]